MVTINFRLAQKDDLNQIKLIFKDISNKMYDEQIQIWNGNYPGEYFEEDINKQRLYLLFKQQDIISAFALCDMDSEERTDKWKYRDGKSLYLYRFAVNVNYLRKGIGSLTLEKAKETAKRLGAKNLRLFVVDINKPAIDFYLNNGFSKIEGVYEDFVNDQLLYEYGYEIRL